MRRTHSRSVQRRRRRPRVRHARSHRPEHPRRARHVPGLVRRLLGVARDHDRAGLCVRNVPHPVDSGRRRHRRRSAPGAAAGGCETAVRVRVAAARRDHPARQQVLEQRHGADGAADTGSRSIRSARDCRARPWLAKRGIHANGFVLENGSGLSRTERVTARGMGEMLDIAWHSPFMPEFAASLPLSATDGTLRNRFNSPGMHGRIRLKTGRIDDVSALAGFVNAASGRTYILVIMINHPGAHAGSGEAIQAELIRWVFGQ